MSRGELQQCRGHTLQQLPAPHSSCLLAVHVAVARGEEGHVLGRGGPRTGERSAGGSAESADAAAPCGHIGLQSAPISLYSFPVVREMGVASAGTKVMVVH